MIPEQKFEIKPTEQTNFVKIWIVRLFVVFVIIVVTIAACN